MTALKKRVLTNPLYKNLLISEDATFTTIIIKTHSHSSLGDDGDVLEGFEEDTAEDRNKNQKPRSRGPILRMKKTAGP